MEAAEAKQVIWEKRGLLAAQEVLEPLAKRAPQESPAVREMLEKLE